VPSVLLKGRAFAALFYAEAPPRPYSDCDLLVPIHLHDRASAVLDRLDFAPDDGFLAPRDLPRETVAGQALHAGHWRRKSDGMLVDLHSSLPEIAADPGLVWEVLERRTTPISVGGSVLSGLDPEGCALLVALHAAHHGPPWEQFLTDLRLAVEQLDESVWSGARTLAAELGALDAFGTGLRLVPAGAALADRLGLAWAPSTNMLLRWEGAPWGATLWEALLRAPGNRVRLALVAAVVAPRPAILRLGSGLARRGSGGLLAAYVLRMLSLAVRAAPALLAWQQGRENAAGRAPR